jgi:uncharacterized protein GlcG (DUF336 family)
MKVNPIFLSSVIFVLVIFSSNLTADEKPVFHNIKRLSLDSALTMAKAAIDQCRKEGTQIAVTVLDRGGHAQAVLRDVFASDITLTISHQKAYTAMMFNSPTVDIEGRFKGAYEVPKVDGILVQQGGLPILAGGTSFGGIGVSGSPDSKTDEICAQAGIDAIIDDLEMSM